GDHVAFVSDRSGEPRVWIRPAAGEPLIPITTLTERVLMVSWSPDGDWLACLTAAVGASRSQIWLVRPDGTDPHRVAGAGSRTAVLGSGPRHGWSADGRLLVTETDGLVSTALLVAPRTGGRQVF